MMQELSLNVLDVAENSVRADASLVEITVEEDTAAGWLTIVIRDNGRGMTPEQVQTVIDPFYTTRTTRKVGLGVPFFRMAAQLSGGDLTIQSRVGEGTAVTATFGLTSIDRMPLGDINGTIATLVQCNPGIDWLYTRRKDGREMVMDTRQFREILEDTPLDSPEVLGFLRDYLAENTAELLAPGAAEQTTEG
ncbi:MAG: ATP-binding protein [Angelakisella sp.]|jgi:anti-sigma regulatory factor (Ser/Thr protein kinase)|nr:ATP-binding protein [Angelakisella sp.]